MNYNQFPAKLDHLISVMHLNIAEYWPDVTKWKNESVESKVDKGGWWVDDSLLKWHFDVLKSCRGGMLLMMFGGEIIAELDYVISSDPKIPSNHRIHSIWLLVSKEHRRRGIAKQLIEYLHRINIASYPVWVEAEDDRSRLLYDNLGYEVEIYQNWEIHEHEFQQVKIASQIDLPIQVTRVGFDSLANELDKFECLLGRYFAPNYDIEQLNRSEIATQFIWGQSTIASLIKFETQSCTYMGVVTQYPRLYFRGKLNRDELILVFRRFFAKIFSQGFKTIFVQTYLSYDLTEILDTVGSKLIKENDAIHQLNSPAD